MRLSQNLNDALNQQIMHEYHNMLVYKQIESYFEELQLKKLSSYFSKQAQHEKEHGDMFLKHINDRTGGKVSLGEVDAPIIGLSSIELIAEAYISIEEGTTESIEEIYGMALDEKSFMDLPFLSNMLSEQIEEEDSAQSFALKIKAVKDIVLFDATFEG